MTNFINKIIFSSLFTLVGVNAEVNNVDRLLEKVKQSTTDNEKKLLLQELKKELFEINKKTTEDAAAILNAKKKIPSKSFNLEKTIK